MKSSLLRIVVWVLLILMVSAALPKISAAGYYGVTWGDPVRLSNPDQQAGQPAVAVDMSGVVHVVWSEYNQSGVAGEGHTIFYSSWDGRNWSQPIDVIVADVGEAAQFPEMTVTPDGYMHVVWSTGGITSVLMHSRVHVCCARDVYAWSRPVAIDSPALGQHTFASDRRGYLYTAFAEVSSSDIVFAISKDNGGTWLRTAEISGGIQRLDEFSVYPRMAVSESGRVHIVWNVLPWPGRLVWYAHSDDEMETWSEPVLIDSSDRAGYQAGFGPIVPDIKTYGENQVHIIWDGAPTVERNHIYSLDDGETWSKPVILFPEITLSGRAGWNEMAFDSAGILHAVSIIGPLHASWDGHGWSESQDIAVRNYTGLGEMIRIRVGLGNQLHVVWLDRGVSPFSVWYVNGVSTVPEIPPAPPPEQDFISVVETAVVPTETAVNETITPVANLEDPVNPLTDYSPGFVVVASLVPVVLVICASAIVALKRRQAAE